jgi:hypothetical protein
VLPGSYVSLYNFGGDQYLASRAGGLSTHSIFEPPMRPDNPDFLFSLSAITGGGFALQEQLQGLWVTTVVSANGKYYTLGLAKALTRAAVFNPRATTESVRCVSGYLGRCNVSLFSTCRCHSAIANVCGTS